MRVSIITGASRGIGRSLAIELSNRNDTEIIVLVARSREGLENTVSLMNQSKKIYYYCIDLTDHKLVEGFVTEIFKMFNSIDLLINVAGYAEPAPLLETTIDNWENTYRVNVHSIFLLTREVVKYMKNSGGQIVNIASTAGSTPRPGWLAYSSSKAAIISMSQTLSEELKEYGISVYCVSPGRCATELRKILAPEEDQSKIMQPEQVAKVISGLLNQRCLEGQNIIVKNK